MNPRTDSLRRISDFYLITPPFSGDVESYLNGLAASLLPDVGLVRLRLGNGTAQEDAQRLVRRAAVICAEAGVGLLIDPSNTASDRCGCGIHLDAKTLMETRARPDSAPFVAASCHDRAELERACAIGVDWVVISPVLPTASHPGAAVLGWAGLERLIAFSTVPVYALGGLGRHHLERAHRAGAAGIAAIRGLWRGAA